MKIINIAFRIFRVILIILFAATAINFEIKQDLPSYIVVGAIIVYVLSLILISVYELIKTKIPDYIKVYVVIFTILISLVFLYLLIYDTETEFKSLYFALVIWMPLYSIWELSAIKKKKNSVQTEA